MQNSLKSLSGSPRRIILIGPGGTGKGTVAQRLVEGGHGVWLSKSWTTRPPRQGEANDAYVFVAQDAFEAHIAEDGFLEWAEFLGHLYGTPDADPPQGHDVLLEIEVEGALQVLERDPSATVILLLPPSEEVQAERMRGRGDPEEKVAARVEKGRKETEIGRSIAHHFVINDDLDLAVAEVVGILERLRLTVGEAKPPIQEQRFPMATKRMTLMDPPVEELLDKVDSKFTLVTLGAKRAREINAYYQGLGEVLGRIIPPQVTSVSGKPLSIAFEEVAQSKVTYHRPDAEELAAEAAAAADAAASGFSDDPFSLGENETSATITEIVEVTELTDGVDVVDVIDVIDVIEEADGTIDVVEVVEVVVDDEVVDVVETVEVIEAVEDDTDSPS